MDSAIQTLGWFTFFALFLGYLFTSEPGRKRTFGWVSVVLAVALSIHAFTPLADQPLIPFFEKEATNKDEDFKKLMAEAHQKAEGFKGSEFVLLKSIVDEGTLTLTKYFPTVVIPKQKNKTRNDINEAILLDVQRRAGGKVRLGLDLKGGSSFLLKVDTKGNPHALEQAQSVLLKRVDKLGLAEPLVQPVGTDRILIQLPGVSEAQRKIAEQTVKQAAYLEFRLVHPENQSHAARAMNDPTYRVPGYTKYERETENEKGDPIREIYFLESVAAIKGDMLAHAMPDVDDHGGYIVSFELKSEGRERFARITEENIGRQLAIVLDGEVFSAPVIRSAILAGRGQIEGSFTREEVIRLAMVLNNPLGSPAELLEVRNVDASLGQDSIRSGVRAGIVGAIAVVIFMAAYYLLLGVIADIAVIFNIIILLGILALFQFTLTLPGLAGIVLTIGMAVDANVLISERIREEIRAGKGLRAAIQAGYGKAFWTIFDSNITTLITAIILILMGSGPVKGFGITLTIGLCVSMFTALVFTRLVVDFLVERGWVTKLPMLRLIRDTKIDFVGMRYYALAVSLIVLLIGAASVAMRGEKIYGIDFRGGVSLMANFENKVDPGEITKALAAAGFTDTMVQYQRDPATGKEALQIKSGPIEEKQKPKLLAAGLTEENIQAGAGRSIEALLMKNFPDAKFSEADLEEVGAVVSSELKWEALLAVAVACVLIMIYIALRFEFGFGIGAIVALIHDALITIGLFSLTGRQFSLPMVAAILTVIGYSINDTIVVFDRIREDLKLYGGRQRFREIINRSINETLSRTLLTAGTTLIACLALYFYGGGIINDFAFTMTVGIITGTFSSIFIASPIVLWWERRQRDKAAAETAAPVPAPADKIVKA